MEFRKGSMLGPLFFIIFINDLPLHIQSSEVKLVLYADDTTLYCSTDVGGTTRLQKNLNSALQDAETGRTAIRLPLNESKTKTLLVSGKRLKEKLRSQADLLSITTSAGKALEQFRSY